LRHAVALALGGGVSAQTLVWSVSGRDPDVYVEGSVIVLGDVDRDGVQDLASVVQVFGGSPPRWCYQVWTYSGATGQRLQEFCPTFDMGVHDLTPMGDVDADGFPDFAITLQSSVLQARTVRVVSWQSGRTLWELNRNSYEGFGDSIL